MNITDADREAAKSILWVATLIDDEDAITHAFATHRLRGYNAGLEAAAVLVDRAYGGLVLGDALSKPGDVAMNVAQALRDTGFLREDGCG